VAHKEQPASEPAEDPGYLTETGEAAGEDGSVVPIIGGLPAALPHAGVARPYPAHAVPTAKIARASQRRQADDDGHGSTHSPQPVRP
jgi:hypothetical protein